MESDKKSMCENGTCPAICSCHWFSMKTTVSVALGILLAASVMALVGAAVHMLKGDRYADRDGMRGMQMKMMQQQMMDDDMSADMMNTMPEGELLPEGEDGVAY